MMSAKTEFNNNNEDADEVDKGDSVRGAAAVMRHSIESLLATTTSRKDEEAEEETKKKNTTMTTTTRRIERAQGNNDGWGEMFVLLLTSILIYSKK